MLCVLILALMFASSAATKIQFNVGGMVFETLRDTVESKRGRTSRLYQLLVQADHDSGGSTTQVFIDRSGMTFAYVLDYLRGEFVPPRDPHLQARLVLDAVFYQVAEEMCGVNQGGVFEPYAWSRPFLWNTHECTEIRPEQTAEWSFSQHWPADPACHFLQELPWETVSRLTQPSLESVLDPFRQPSQPKYFYIVRPTVYASERDGFTSNIFHTFFTTAFSTAAETSSPTATPPSFLLAARIDEPHLLPGSFRGATPRRVLLLGFSNHLNSHVTCSMFHQPRLGYGGQDHSLSPDREHSTFTFTDEGFLLRTAQYTINADFDRRIVTLHRTNSRQGFSGAPPVYTLLEMVLLQVKERPHS